MKRLLAFSALVWLSGGSARAQGPLPRLLHSDSVLAPVARAAGRHRLQVLYTQIRRDGQGRPHFREYRYRLRPREYFYPASAIKLPTAILALEKVHRLAAQVPGLSSSSPMLTDSASAGQTRVLRDTSSRNQRASVGKYVRKLLLVSDNDAYNRLYEFVGPAALQAGLRRHGLRHTVLRHRLSVADQDATARNTNPVALFADSSLSRPLYVQPPATFAGKWRKGPPRRRTVGAAYLQNGQRINRPMPFAARNATTLPDLQRTLRMVLFPASVPARQRFALDTLDRRLLLDNLHRQPRHSPWPRYAPSRYPDNYAKFLLAGGAPGGLPAGVRSYNKIGQAYGFLIDNAYITDPANGVEFLLSVVLYVNADGVLNDDQYDYDAVGLPFLRRLGEAVYQLERARRR